MLYSITVCPTLNLLLKALNPVSAEEQGEIHTGGKIRKTLKDNGNFDAFC